MKHKVGDRVRVDCPGSDVNGLECTVTAVGVTGCRRGIGFIGCEVDIPKLNGTRFPYCVFKDEWLIPLYDGNEKTSWEDIKEIWSPLETA